MGQGRITRSLEGEGHFSGEHHGEGYARQREQYARKLVDRVVLGLGSGGGSIQDTKGCLFRVPFNSHDLDSSLEMTGTIHRTLICLALEFIVLEELWRAIWWLEVQGILPKHQVCVAATLQLYRQNPRGVGKLKEGLEGTKAVHSLWVLSLPKAKLDEGYGF